MARTKKKKSDFRDHRLGLKNVGNAFCDLTVQMGKEVTGISAYAARELTGQPHHKKPKVGLKKGWFE